MTKLNIDTGALGNPATGDSLRTAMTKINSNFDELYIGLSQTDDNGGLITTEVTNGDMRIQPNGTGVVEIDQLQIDSDSITSLVTNGNITLAGNGAGNVIVEAITVNGTTLSSTDSTKITLAENVDITGNLVVGGTLDLSDSNFTNVGALQLDSIAGDGDTNTSITFSGSDVITIATGGSGRLTIGDGALTPVTNNQIDLGTSSLEFKNAFFDGTVTSDAFAGPLTGNVTGNASGTAATVTGAAQTNITSVGTLTTLAVTGATSLTTTNIDNLNIQDNTISSDSNADINLSAGGTGNIVAQSPFIAATFTTTQRNSLTAVNGMIIYNSTTNQLEGRENGAWVSLRGDTADSG